MPSVIRTRYLALLGTSMMPVLAIGMSHRWIVREDGPVEYATAVIFVLAALLAAGVAIHGRSAQIARDRLTFVGIALLATILALSELSFGARLFDFQMPKMAGGGEFDGGHDIVIWTLRRIANATQRTRAAVALLALAAAATTLVWAWRRRAALTAMATRFLASPVRFRLATAILLLAGAVVLDLVPNPRVAVLEETMELAASIALLTSVTTVLVVRPRSARAGASPFRRTDDRAVGLSSTGSAQP